MGKVYRVFGKVESEMYGWKNLKTVVRKYLPAYQMLTDFKIIEPDGSVRYGKPLDFFVVKDSDVYLLKHEMIDEFRISP